MAGLLEDSVAAGNLAYRGLEDATEQAAQHQNMDLQQKMGLQEGIGQAVGEFAGKKLEEKRLKANNAKPKTQPASDSATPDDTNSTDFPGMLEADRPSAEVQGLGATDPGFSMMWGTVLKRGEGGLLNNKAPPMEVGISSGNMGLFGGDNDPVGLANGGAN